MDKNMCVCYAIKNKINGKIYVGTTNNIITRIKGHMSLLNNGSHTNKAWQKEHKDFSLSESDYEYYCLQENIRSQDRYDVEISYMLLLKSYIPEIGYNAKEPRLLKHIQKSKSKEITIIYDIPKTNA